MFQRRRNSREMRPTRTEPRTNIITHRATTPAFVVLPSAKEHQDRLLWMSRRRLRRRAPSYDSFARRAAAPGIVNQVCEISQFLPASFIATSTPVSMSIFQEAFLATVYIASRKESTNIDQNSFSHTLICHTPCTMPRALLPAYSGPSEAPACEVIHPHGVEV